MHRNAPRRATYQIDLCPQRIVSDQSAFDGRRPACQEEQGMKEERRAAAAPTAPAIVARPATGSPWPHDEGLDAVGASY
jgi:hypothetical protein